MVSNYDFSYKVHHLLFIIVWHSLPSQEDGWLYQTIFITVLITFCRQAKLNATTKVIEDIDESQGLHNYYSKGCQPKKEPASHNLFSK